MERASFFMVKPSWTEHQKNLSSDNEVVADRAADGFIETRNNEMKTSPIARSWEEGRKKEWADNKPEYIRKRNAAEKDPAKKTIAKLLDGGNFDTGIVPSPGLILISLDTVPTQMGELYLPVSNDDTPNTGRVIEVGEELVLENGAVIRFPHKVGDKVIIRKFSANLHVNINGEKYYFLLFSDVLGRFK